ncbi:hypothetical protein DMN50_15445, partial [Priestia megaterium]
TDEIASDLKRKITLITPECFVGTSGQESTSLLASILRNCLFNSSLDKNPLGHLGEKRHKLIKDLYDQVNNVFMINHRLNEPMGHIMIADCDSEAHEFNLFVTGGYEGFKEFTKVDRIGVIGASSQIRHNVKTKLEKLLNEVPEEKLNFEYIFEPLAKDVQRIIQNFTTDYVGVGESMYCTYLTLDNNIPASSVFFLKPDGKLKPMDKYDNSEYLKVPE